MKYAARLPALVIALLCVPLASCARTVIQSNASHCSALLPDSWAKGVAPVDLPTPATLADGHDDAKPWQEGFIGQTGQLEIANGRYVDGMGIIRRCEARDDAAVKKVKRRLF